MWKQTYLLIAAACIALAATPAISQDTDYTWKPHVSACKVGTLESWLRTHGRKFRSGFEQVGPLLIGEITWDNGKRQMVYVAPRGNDFCVLAAARGNPA